MFKLNEEFTVKSIVIKRGFEGDDGNYERLIMLEPFYYVSREEDFDALDSVEVDFFGCEIGANLKSFENQNELIVKKIEEGRQNIKEKRLLYSLKKLKALISGDKSIKVRHQIEYRETGITYFIDKYGELDCNYRDISGRLL